jgi:hypothetical protein
MEHWRLAARPERAHDGGRRPSAGRGQTSHLILARQLNRIDTTGQDRRMAGGEPGPGRLLHDVERDIDADGLAVDAIRGGRVLAGLAVAEEKAVP